jgi:hypothetical protein
MYAFKQMKMMKLLFEVPQIQDDRRLEKKQGMSSKSDKKKN